MSGCGTPEVQPFFGPEEIESRSFAIIDAEVPEPRPYEGLAWEVVRRMIHTTADFEILSLVRIHERALEGGLAALRDGCTVFTDTEMARCGIPVRRMDPLGCTVRCLMNDPAVKAEAKRLGATRASVAMEASAADLPGSIVVIGNAPTALLRLLDFLRECPDKAPALVVGMPVGFVNAAESKALLIQESPVPFVTVEGRKGGSAMAACVINALAAHLLHNSTVT